MEEGAGTELQLHVVVFPVRRAPLRAYPARSGARVGFREFVCNGM